MQKRTQKQEETITNMRQQGFDVDKEFQYVNRLYMVSPGGAYITILKSGHVRAGKH